MTSSGNRCGHDPRNPRLELEHPATRGKPFPYLIRELLSRLERLYRDRALFPELGARKRSERIEAMVLVGKAIARNTDRLTLRSGRQHPDGTVTGITMSSIAKWARIGVERAYRACWDLRDAGYVECTQPIEERHDGSRRGLAGIRRLTPKLFQRVDLGGRLKRDRRQLYEQQRNRQVAETIAERRRLRRLFRASHRASVLAKRTTQQLAERARLTETVSEGMQRAQRAAEELARRIARGDDEP